MISLLREISLNYEMTTIVSIHQPSNDLFQMFDNIYVLAKGGVCVYSGPPNALKQHLNECGVECNENQVSIEVLLEVSSKEKTNQMIQNMVQKTKIENNDNNNNQCLKKVDAIQNPTKTLNYRDFHNLLMRNILLNYRHNWLRVLIKFASYLFLAFIVKFTVSPKVAVPRGCIEFNLGIGCNQTLEEIDDSFYLKQNLIYHFFFIYFVSTLVLVINCGGFCAEYKILRNQNRNGM